MIIERDNIKPCMHFDPVVKDEIIITQEPDTQYWWKVTDIDENGGSTVSDVHTFTTKSKPGR